MIRMLYDNLAQQGDLVRDGGNLVDGLDLETAVQISVMTEARVAVGDEEDEGLEYRGGWWADATNDDGDLIGSRMWMLKRKKATASNINLARTYIQESLQWMLDDGVAKEIAVTTARGETPVGLRYSVTITRPDGTTWSRVWDLQLDEL